MILSNPKLNPSQAAQPQYLLQGNAGRAVPCKFIGSLTTGSLSISEKISPPLQCRLLHCQISRLFNIPLQITQSAVFRVTSTNDRHGVSRTAPKIRNTSHHHSQQWLEALDGSQLCAPSSLAPLRQNMSLSSCSSRALFCNSFKSFRKLSSLV